MRWLIDTGVLLRLFDASDEHSPSIRTAIKQLIGGSDTLCIAAQNAAEFWNVSTRPLTARGGYGQSVESTERRLTFLERRFVLLTETLESHRIWRKLLIDSKVTGVAVHDARLVAVMIDSGVTSVLTLNAADFRRYDAVSAVSPTELQKTTGR